jgi:hypothetical protein
MSLDAGEVQSVLKMRDEMSGVVNAAMRNARSAFGEGGAAASSFGSILTTAAGTLSGFLGAQAIMGAVSAGFSAAKESVFGMNATLETATLQFATLMGDSDKAKQHVLDLFEIAKKTPFETGPIIEASRMLQTFGGNALNTKANIMLLGDAAAATGAPINELGMWTGRMYAAMQAGKPFGEASQRLGELAVMTPKARLQLEAMQTSGASAHDMFKVFTDSLQKFGGAMEKQAGTWQGVTSTFSDTVNLLVAGAFKPLFEVTRDALASINDILGSDAFATRAEALSKAIANGVVVAVQMAKEGFSLLRAAVEPLMSVWNDLVGLGVEIYQAFQNVHLSSAKAGAVWSGLVATSQGLWQILVLVAQILIAAVDKLGLLQAASVIVNLAMQGLAFILSNVGGALSWVADKVRWLMESVGLLDKNVTPAKEGVAAMAEASKMLAGAQQQAAVATDGVTAATKSAAAAGTEMGESFTKTSKASTAFTKELKDLRDELAIGMKRMDDTAFAKRFGDDLDKILPQLQEFGVTGTKVPADIQAAFAKLMEARIGEELHKEMQKAAGGGDELDKLSDQMTAFGLVGTAVPQGVADAFSALLQLRIGELMKKDMAEAAKGAIDFGGAVIDTEGEITKAIGESLKIQFDARRQAADLMTQVDLTRAQTAIDLAKREGASKQQIYQMEIDLLSQKTNAELAQEQRTFEEKTRLLDLTTQHGRDAYDALYQAHLAMQTKILADSQQTAGAMQISWHDSLDDLMKSFAQLGQIGGGVIGNITKGIGTAIGAFDTASKGIKSMHSGFAEMTSGGGLGSILGGISGIVGGIGGIVAAASAAVSAIKAIFGAFQSEETKKVNKPRDQFMAQFGGFDGLANALTQALIDKGEADAGNKASRLIANLQDADTEAKFHAAEAAIQSVMPNIRTFAAGTPGLGFQDFGDGTLAVLHHREAVVREDQAGAFAAKHGESFSAAMLHATLERIDRSLQDMPRANAIAMQDALALAPR